ncbi:MULTISPECIES: bifunctional folylpolyglutamate synthase/dihydrofolate synthase [unclassified Plantibacter]|uniref:bifunctional folylpolyglutamate synthase/dihydrofolate synthase n=1 Tax=unclassified Plantibacter TaxID=2624265 RepID=UPI003D3513B8
MSDPVEAADAVYRELLERLGEAQPQPRLGPTKRALELLGNPESSFAIIQVAGTNGKTSTSRMIESILRAHDLRTGLFTSPHLVRFTERISIDGERISDEAVAHNWDDIKPYLKMVDDELEAAGEPRLTFFEALTVLAFASFGDAPVDVAVVEVGMGGSWDSTNAADADVAVFAPIDLDHMQRLGSTITEIARTKAGIIKPGAQVVSAAQTADARRELVAAAEAAGDPIAFEGEDFALVQDAVGVGGQLITVRGRAGTYPELYLPFYGDHQGRNATLAIAAVEAFLGGATRPLAETVLAEGLAEATSPGRLQLIGTEPTVLVDAAHNPHGARALVAALGTYFDVDEIAFVVGIVADKDARGILETFAPAASLLVITQSESERAIPAEELGRIAESLAIPELPVYDRLDEAADVARRWAAEGERRLVVITGSITLVGEAIEIAADREWKVKA